MKNDSLNQASIYQNIEFKGKPLNTARSFYQPILELIQMFYTEKGLFDVYDPSKSTFLIGGPYQYEIADWGTKPTIIVNRGAIQGNTRRSMRQMQHVQAKDGTTYYQDQAMGTFTIRVVTDSMLETENIASEIFDMLWLLKHDQLTRFGIYEMRELSLSPVSKLTGGSIEHLMICTISSTIILNKRWSVKPTDAPILKGVKCNVDIQGT